MDPRWRALAQKLRKKGKPGSVVAAAIANRWVRWLFHQMKQIGSSPEAGLSSGITQTQENRPAA
jgi:hypothetical protein